MAGSKHHAVLTQPPAQAAKAPKQKALPMKHRHSSVVHVNRMSHVKRARPH